MELVGKVVRKEIAGVGFCYGKVRSCDSSGFLEIVYENGVTEISKKTEVVAIVLGEGKSQETSVQVKPGVGRSSRKQPPARIKRFSSCGGMANLQNEVHGLRNADLSNVIVENSGISNCLGVDLNCSPVENIDRTWESRMDLNRTVPELKTAVDLNTGLDCNLSEGLGLNSANIDREGNCSDKRREFIDLNMDASCDLENAEDYALIAPKRGGGFDLNLEVNVENSKDDVFVQMNGNDIVQEINMQDKNGVNDNPKTGEYNEVCVPEVSGPQVLEKIQKQNIVPLQDLNCPDPNGAERDHDLLEQDAKTVDEYTSGRRKRRKGSENSKFTRQPWLRRSAHEKLARPPVSNTVSACLADGVFPSPSVSSLTEEKTWIDGKAENISVLPPKPQLPPSSHILNLDGLPILDVFTVYSCLRSFSTLLFLSPFELKDFVEALRCISPSLLFDSIHVSVMQILNKHLKQLAAEGDLSASACLRSLDWDMLDVVTYPIFVAEYLLFSGSKDNPGMDLTRLKFFRNEYSRQPMNLKIEILNRLCDDMTNAEVLRSELNKRSFASESDMFFDRNTNTGRRNLTMVELADDLSLNNEVTHGSIDRNNDDCCLCKMDGNLLCCDGCPAAYHSKCVGVASHLLPEGDWYCPECAFDRRVPGLKSDKKIRGAEFVAIDPHGRNYYRSCGYLLVIDTDGSGSGSGSLNYYHVNDLILVLELLNSCGSFYIGVMSAITKHWDIPVGLKRTIGGVQSQMSVCLDNSAKGIIHSIDGFKAPLPASEKQSKSGVKKKLGSRNHCQRTCRKVSESATGLDTLNVQSETGYINHYIFAQMTTPIFEEMMRKSLIRTNDMRSDEEIASTQLKTILMKTTKFHWRRIQSLYLDAWKEKCGWCHSCKISSENAGSEANCLFNMSLGELRGPWESEISNGQCIDKESDILAIIYQILSMESRLQGLLVGPWLNPQHSRIWREHILNASNISRLKSLLLELEANLHHRVISLGWLNHVDSASVMGSAIHILNASTRSWSKTAFGKRWGTLLESGVNPITKKNVGLTMCWWRGGRLSRQLFNWKVLPRSLISKAARQGGSMNIPGILYPENSESAKRSRRIAWEAAVESSTTSEQLGLQVRTLHSYIKWDDIEDSHLLPALDKESRKSARMFKKAIVRRKCTEEETVKYLIDFGKRRIPDVVLENGCMVEESSSGRKKFWLNESYVPLHLLKRYEEKKAVRRISKPRGSFRHSELDTVRKRSSKGKGFSYLFERAERSDSSLCEQYTEDVPLSEAACCHICKRLFHKKHMRRSEKEGKHMCLQCRSEVIAKEQPSVPKRGRRPGIFRRRIGVQTQKRKKGIPACKSAQTTKTSLAEKISIRLKNHKKVVTRKPMRRSGRIRNDIVRLQNESFVPGRSKKRKLETGRDRGRPKKVKEDISVRKQRTKRYLGYWLNGLMLSRKPGDERVNKFQKDRYYLPMENPDPDDDETKCHICNSNESGSTIIVCETCGKWYHGDAYGLNAKNSSVVIGFRCHICRKQSSPICPYMRSTTFPVRS